MWRAARPSRCSSWRWSAWWPMMAMCEARSHGTEAAQPFHGLVLRPGGPSPVILRDELRRPRRRRWLTSGVRVHRDDAEGRHPAAGAHDATRLAAATSRPAGPADGFRLRARTPFVEGRSPHAPSCGPATTPACDPDRTTEDSHMTARDGKSAAATGGGVALESRFGDRAYVPGAATPEPLGVRSVYNRAPGGSCAAQAATRSCGLVAAHGPHWLDVSGLAY